MSLRTTRRTLRLIEFEIECCLDQDEKGGEDCSISWCTGLSALSKSVTSHDMSSQANEPQPPGIAPACEQSPHDLIRPHVTLPDQPVQPYLNTSEGQASAENEEATQSPTEWFQGLLQRGGTQLRGDTRLHEDDKLDHMNSAETESQGGASGFLAFLNVQ